MKGLLLVYDIDAVIQTGGSAIKPGTTVGLLVKEGDFRAAKEILSNTEDVI